MKVEPSFSSIKSCESHDMIKLKKKWPQTVSIAWANENHLLVNLENDLETVQISDNFNSDYMLGIEFFL